MPTPQPPSPPPVQPSRAAARPLPSVAALAGSLIDYAGLFPPAKLAMGAAVDNYAQYIRSGDSWMLGRFICPVSALEEFRRAARTHLPRVGSDEPEHVLDARHPTEELDDELDEEALAAGEPVAADPSEPWRISAIIDGDLDENLDAIFAFNHEHEQPRNGLALIDAIELRAPSVAFIDEALDLIPEEVFPFFEIPHAGDTRGYIAALAGSDAAAKIRTGGVTPEAFPTCEQVAAFILACAAADVPFKATAGLHHPVRAEHRLTYEPDSPRGVMHGFLNVFLAAALAHGRAGEVDPRLIARLLDERNPRSLTFERGGVAWNDHRLSVEQLAAARGGFALSYGSCSFTEPADDLRAMGLL